MYCNYLNICFYFNILEFWRLVRFINKVLVLSKIFLGINNKTKLMSIIISLGDEAPPGIDTCGTLTRPIGFLGNEAYRILGFVLTL